MIGKQAQINMVIRVFSWYTDLIILISECGTCKGHYYIFLHSQHPCNQRKEEAN